MVNINKHIPALDGLRTIAALTVVYYHFSYPYMMAGNLGAVTQTIYDIAHFGWLGVDLFFVLSGFLITGILVRERGKPNYYTSFYARRTLRIFPIYYAVLVAYFILIPIVYKHIASPIAVENQLWLWLYLTNMVYPVKEFGDLSHFWSLAVEEHFYLMWPFIVKKLRDSTLLKLGLAVMGVALLWRWGLYSQGVDPDFIGRNTFSRLDSLLIGAMAAILIRRLPSDESRKLAKKAICFFGPLFLLSLVACLWQPLYRKLMIFSFYPVYAVFFAGVIVYAVLTPDRNHNWFTKLINHKFMTQVGLYSYGVYVFHLPCQRISSVIESRVLGGLQEYRGHFLYQNLWIVFQIALVIAISALSWHCFERLFLKLKDRFSY